MNITFIDITGLIAAALITWGYVPQAVKTIRTRSTDDIAMTSFLFMALGALFFTIQGFLTHNYYLAAANFCTSTMSSIIFGIKIYNDAKKRKSHNKTVSGGNNNIQIPLRQGVGGKSSESLGFASEYVTNDYIKKLLKYRIDDAHKGTYGHALLICGSGNMPGAAVLATGAALRSGCGLVTCHLPASIRTIVSVNWPSALLSIDRSDCFSEVPDDLTKYRCIGCGPGLGQNVRSVQALADLLKACSASQLPMVLDADALNILARHADMQHFVPKGSILTPHMGELRRLIGEWKDETEKITRIEKLSERLQCIVIAKGPHTMICGAGRPLLFNTTGNSGMAKGGSGDVLTGLLVGLRARGYESYEAAAIGVYIHGAAGDKARDRFGDEAMNSRDIIDFLGDVILDIR